MTEETQHKAAPAGDAAGDFYGTEDMAPPPAGVRKGSGAGAGFAVLIQAAIVLTALALIWYAAQLSLAVDSAIQQIYQLMLFSSGVSLIAIVGVWAAIDAVRRAISP